jgi:OCT family organic cation transporter-like MFS transporter 4/5
MGYDSLAKLQIFLVMFGRLTAGLGFSMVYLYTAELFPTSIRSTAIGSCSTMARVGGMYVLFRRFPLHTFK